MSTRQSSSYLSNFRLQGYNGIEDVDSWLERFELFAQRENIDAEQMYKDLQLCLVDGAGLWYSTVAKKEPTIKDYATLKAALSTRFSLIDKDEIPNIEQSPVETVDQYFNRFISLIRYCELTEGQKVSLFIKGLNSLYRTQVKLNEPKTVEDARRRAKLVADATGIQPGVAPVSALEPNIQTLQTVMQESLVQPIKQAMESLNQKFEGLLRETQNLRKSQPRASDRSKASLQGQGYFNRIQAQQSQQHPQKQHIPHQQNSYQQNQHTCPHCNGKARFCSFFYNNVCPGQKATCYECNEVGHLRYVH
jgi:hypothetical protein